MKCKHKDCNNNRFWRLWAIGYCYKHAFEFASTDPLFELPIGTLLYTAPQIKELSDEEIDDLADEILGIQSTEDIAYIREFARAIMERCGIISGTDK